MQEATFHVSGPPRYQHTITHPRLVRWITGLLPVLILSIVGGSLAGLQWAGAHSIALGYPQPTVQLAILPDQTLIRTQSYSFSATASGRDLSYFWDFGDQSDATGSTVSHIYQSNNTFTVTITVTDPAGHQATRSEAVTVVPPAPQAAFTCTTEYGGYISCDASNSTADSSTSIASYNWDFGDGSQGDSTGYPQDSHYYYNSGTYQVTLIIVDATGQRSNAATMMVSL